MSLDLDDRQRAMLQEMGVHVWLPSAEPVQEDAYARAVRVAQQQPVPAAVATAAAAPRAAAVATQPDPAPADTASMAGEAMALHGLRGPALRQSAAACQACGLCAGRKHSTLRMPDELVQADWMVVGDPPEEDEDRMGQPFVEQPGLLLDNMLKAVGASRSGQGRQGAYLSNVVKCRPPTGRLPQAAELAQCAQYLQREIALVQPKLILAMGRFAAQLLLEEHPTDAALPLGKQRGRVYRYQGVPVIVSYHPKVLLRASADKAKAWADLCLALDVLESLPPRPAATRVAAPQED
nr:uracil-DNA glycosylase [Rhodoferax sp.]